MEVATVAIDESVIVILSAPVTSHNNVTISPGNSPVSCDGLKLVIVGGASAVTVTESVVVPIAFVAAIV